MITTIAVKYINLHCKHLKNKNMKNLGLNGTRNHDPAIAMQRSNCAIKETGS